MKFCDIHGCGVSVTDAQADTSQKLFGKIVCVNHEKDAAAEASKHSDRFTLDTAPYIKCGFTAENGIASKVIGQAEITIEIAKVGDEHASKKKYIQIGGYDYELGLNTEVDKEIKALFELIKPKKGGAGENKKEIKPAPVKTSEGTKDETKTETDTKNKEVARDVPATTAAKKIIETPKLKPDALIPAKTFTPQGSMIKGFVPQLREIGKIKIGRKGEKKTASGHRLPEKFDHFEIMSLIRDENGDFIPDTIMASLGEKPKELSVMLLYNDPTLNFTSRYNAYKGGKCLCSGDGVTARNLAGEKMVCNPETCETFQKKGCKPNGILSVILTDSPRLGGVYKFRTTSYNSIRSILSSLFFLRSLTGGVLAMIPLKLTVAPMTVQPRDSPTAQTIYVVNIEFPGTAGELLEKTIEVSKYQGTMRAEIQSLEATARLSLAAPESEEEIKEVEAEYYPEQGAK